MTVNENESRSISPGTEIEVLWHVEDRAVWWPATVENDRGSIRIRYHADLSLGHDEVLAEVTILPDGTLREGSETLRWRQKGSAEGDDDDDDVDADDDADFEDDPSQPASTVICHALSQAMNERSDAEQRLLAERVSDALAAFKAEVAESLQGLAPEAEVDDRVAEGIIKRMASKMRDADAMSDGGGSECSLGSM